MNFDNFNVDINPLLNYSKRIAFNRQLAEFYREMYEKSDKIDDTLLRKADSIERCGTVWDIDYYRFLGKKDITRVNLCRNKFCSNCQSHIASNREKKFRPILFELENEYDLYHISFTQTNVPGYQLKATLNLMYKSYRKLNQYLLGTKKIRGMDFVGAYGYGGSVKSLEITQSKKDGRFHPHFHCIFLVRKGLEWNERHENAYSWSNGEFYKYFTDFELHLQKIWFLLINGQKVTKKNIEDIDVGYSVVANRIQDSDYKEVFKYAFKNNLNEGTYFTSETLELYEDVLFRRRIISGHGVLYNYDFEDESLTDFEADIEYLEIMANMRDIETPVRIFEPLNELLFNIETDKNVKYISRQSIKNYIIEQRIKAAAADADSGGNLERREKPRPAEKCLT